MLSMGIIDLELLNNYFVAESPPRDSVLLKAVAFFFAELLVSRTLRDREAQSLTGMKGRNINNATLTA
jgi:hypothetical protein